MALQLLDELDHLVLALLQPPEELLAREAAARALLALERRRHLRLETPLALVVLDDRNLVVLHELRRDARERKLREALRLQLLERLERRGVRLGPVLAHLLDARDAHAPRPDHAKVEGRRLAILPPLHVGWRRRQRCGSPPPIEEVGARNYPTDGLRLGPFCIGHWAGWARCRWCTLAAAAARSKHSAFR